jgi:two-component system C4-dicarboxylate transport sensor histidine kinase DctB
MKNPFKIKLARSHAAEEKQRARNGRTGISRWVRETGNVRRLATTLTWLMLIAAAAYFSYSATRRQELEELRTAMENRSQLTGARIMAPVDKFSYLPTVVAQYRIMSNALLNPKEAGHVADANALLERLNREAGSAVLYLLNLEGTTIAASNWKEPESFIGKNYAFRPYFGNALKHGSDRFYGVGVTSRTPGYYISRLVQHNGVPLGVAVAKIDIRDLGAGWEEGNEDIVVTDEHGIIFLSSRPEWRYRPWQPLDADSLEQLKRSRQYEGVLKAPLWVELEETLGPQSRIVSIGETRQPWYRFGMGATTYLVERRALPDSSWTVNVLAPVATINARARRSALVAAGAATLLALLFMYLNLMRLRTREREASRLALEQAHQALAQKHADLQALSEELRIKSVTDVLTGIYNRRFFLDTAAKLISAANRHQFPLSIIMIDVDHFKRINDEHGHPAGDKVLQSLASLYREEMRETDILARFGGEEFIIALPHTDAPSAHILAERIRSRVMHYPVDTESGTLMVTISCGIAQYQPADSGLDAVIKRADDALYAAKNNGRNRIETG